MQDIKGDFIKSVILSNSIGASFQHGNVYAKNAGPDASMRVHKAIEEVLGTILESYYSGPVEENVHIKNIGLLADKVSDKCSLILVNGRFRIGTAQKLLNVYVKFLWCLGKIPEPPHCPFDSNIIWELRHHLNKEYTWTTLDDMKEYCFLVEAAKKESGEMSLAHWELEIWQKISRKSE